MQTATGNGYQKVASASFILGAAVIVLIAAILLISSLLFTTGHRLSPSSFWLALAVTVVAAWLMCSRYFPDRRWLALIGILAVLAAVFLLGSYCSGKFYDLSCDGQAYHQEAIIQLANGWNPFHSQPLQIASGIWINHYTKGPWIASASLYMLTGHIEQGKVFNLLLIISSFLLCLSALSAHYRRGAPEPALFSALAACNPIAILQSPTFYLDGQLSSILIIILSLLYLIINSPDVFLAPVLLLSVIIAVNIKFTALAYILALGLPVLLYLFFVKEGRPFKLIASSLGIGLIAGVLLVGFNPYVSNTVRNGNPFYPLAGPHAVDIVTANSPAEFPTMNRFEKLLISTFSKTEDAAGPRPAHWKWPFTISKEELKAIYLDTRIAGFGPLFGGAVLLSVILLATAWPVDKKKTLTYACLGLLIICSALVNPEAWWARYVPQLWLLPVLCAMFGLASNGKPQRILGLAIILVLCLNLYLVSGAYFHRQRQENALLNSQLAEMRTAHHVLVSFGSDQSNRVRLAEAGIHYREVGRLDGPGVQTLNFSDTKFLDYPVEPAADPWSLTQEKAAVPAELAEQ
jgi:hypothetical protein